MASELDDPRAPLDKVLTPGNPLSRLDNIEGQIAPSLQADTKSDLTDEGGPDIIDFQICPAPGVTVTDPTDPTFTGSFICAEGIEFSQGTFHSGYVYLGNLICGYNADLARFVVAGGAVYWDADGFHAGGSELDAGVLLSQDGWVSQQDVTVGSERRITRIGMRSNETYSESVLQYSEPGSAVTIPNGDFASADMTDWTETQKGLIFSALGDLSTTFRITCMAMIGSDLYVGFVTSGAATKGVYKYTSATSSWAAYGGTLGGIPVAMAVIGSDLYVACETASGTSCVKKSAAGGDFASYGAMSTSDTPTAILAVGSDLYLALSSHPATSCVYKSTGGGDFAAYGALTNTFHPKALAVIGADIYCGGSDFTTSAVYKSAAGGNFAAYGALTATLTVRGLAVISSDIYAATSSGVYKSAGGAAWAAYGSSVGFNCYYFVVSGSDLYVATTAGSYVDAVYCSKAAANFTILRSDTGKSIYSLFISSGVLYIGYNYESPASSSSVWYEKVSDWSGANGYAEITSLYTVVPEFTNAARYAVTAGTKYTFAAENYAHLSAGSGTLTITLQVKFYTAVSGGSLVSTVTITTRTGSSLGLINSNKAITVPATATHAVFVAKVSSTGGTLYGKFDNFTVDASTIQEMIFDDFGGNIPGLWGDNAEVSITGSNYATVGRWHVCSGGTYTLGIPTASGCAGRFIGLRITATGVVTLDGDGSETIGGTATRKLIAGDSIVIKSDGTNWVIVSSNYAPIQFSANLSATVNNVTGDGTTYTVICDTEITDAAGAYNNSTGTFTAPVNGYYSFSGVARLQGLSSHELVQYWFSNWPAITIHGTNVFTGSYLQQNISVNGIYLAAGATVNFYIYGEGGTKVIDIEGAGNVTHFEGICTARA